MTLEHQGISTSSSTAYFQTRFWEWGGKQRCPR